MEKLLKFDFYQVVMPDVEQRTFESILDEVNALEGAVRTFDNGEHHVRLVALTPQQGHFRGDIARIRMNDIPDSRTMVSGTDILTR